MPGMPLKINIYGGLTTIEVGKFQAVQERQRIEANKLSRLEESSHVLAWPRILSSTRFAQAYV